MTQKKIWIYKEKQGKWKNITHLFPETADLHEIADNYNQHHLDQHYWISKEKPGKKELGEIRVAKLHDEIEN